jgi:hypothetical protein
MIFFISWISKPGAKKLTMNEIPNIKLTNGCLEGTVSLPIWKDFQSRQGAYGSPDTDENSNGVFRISIGGDSIVDTTVITTEHLHAYNYLTTHSEQVCKAILARLFEDYKDLQADYRLDYDNDDLKETMPDVDTIEQFKNLIGLSQIHIINVSKDGLAYVGYEFGCTWDDGHGLGFMTHKDRIIDFGGADSSFMTWAATSDLNP